MLSRERYYQNSQALCASAGMNGLTLPMLRLISSKGQGCKDFCTLLSKPCHVGTHWIALTECQGYSHFSGVLPHFVCTKLATSSNIRVDNNIEYSSN